MRFMRALCLLVPMLAANVHCDSKGPSGCTGADCCTGQEAVCPGHPYAACVEVQQSAGRCVDWSMVGATACSTGPQDCPASRPSASFPGVPAGSSSAVCVKATDIQFTTGPASTGYCAAVESYSDPTGAATCTPNPCGATGYCSFVHAAGAAVVSCLWPI